MIDDARWAFAGAADDRPRLLLLQAWPFTGPEAMRLRDCLDAAERARCDRFRFERDRNLFLLGRALLRHCLGAMTGMAAGEIEFEYNAFGKPALAGAPGVWFNLSHSEGALAIALSRSGRVGVDLERATPGRAALDAAPMCFTSGEMQALKARPIARRHELFFRLWTLKEAYLKARGEGLSVALQSFEFAVDRDDIRLCAAAGDDARWQFDQAAVFDDYLWALARDVSAAEAPTAVQVALLDRSGLAQLMAD